MIVDPPTIRCDLMQYQICTKEKIIYIQYKIHITTYYKLFLYSDFSSTSSSTLHIFLVWFNSFFFSYEALDRKCIIFFLNNFRFNISNNFISNSIFFYGINEMKTVFWTIQSTSTYTTHRWDASTQTNKKRIFCFAFRRWLLFNCFNLICVLPSSLSFL